MPTPTLMIPAVREQDKMQTFENLNSQYWDMVKPLHVGCVNTGVACKVGNSEKVHPHTKPEMHGSVLCNVPYSIVCQ